MFWVEHQVEPFEVCFGDFMHAGLMRGVREPRRGMVLSGVELCRDERQRNN